MKNSCNFAIAFDSVSLLEVLHLLNSNSLKGSESHSEILFFGEKINSSNINKIILLEN